MRKHVGGGRFSEVPSITDDGDIMHPNARPPDGYARLASSVCATASPTLVSSSSPKSLVLGHSPVAMFVSGGIEDSRELRRTAA